MEKRKKVWTVVGGLGLAIAIAIIVGSAHTSAAPFARGTVGCPSGYSLVRLGGDAYDCTKTTREFVHVGCDPLWLHQALDAKDTCKGADTSVNPGHLTCLTLPVFTKPGAGGWQYEVLRGGDRCVKSKTDSVKPIIQ